MGKLSRMQFNLLVNEAVDVLQEIEPRIKSSKARTIAERIVIKTNKLMEDKYVRQVLKGNSHE